MTTAGRTVSERGLVLTGATIVDTHDGDLRPGMTIVVEHGAIVKIGSAESIGGTGSALEIDARGTFVVPGFNDLHAHPLNSSDPNSALTLLLANGVTGFRQMSGTTETLAARRAGTLMPPIPAPELLELAGEILTKANARTTEAVVVEIQKQHAQGADFIKVIDVDSDVFFAGLAECTRLGLRYIGHLPPAVDVSEAARGGMRSIEHLGPRDGILLGCSSDEPALRRQIAEHPPKKQQLAGPIPEGVIRRAVANPTLFTDPAEFIRYQRVVDTFSEDKLHRLAGEFVAGGTWQVPTLIRLRTQERGDDSAFRHDPNLRYVPLAAREMWEELALQFEVKMTAQTRASLDALFALQLRLLRMLKDDGVKMMAGSDLGGGWVIPGYGLHQEFDLLAEAGLSPLEVLQLTTLNGAEFLEREATMGSVDEGKDANLVLLAANPMASVQNLHGISAVVRAGTYYSADALDALKDETEARLATLPQPATPRRPPCC